MREIGGYIELDRYSNQMLHEDAIKLNCAKNCLAYLITKKHIKRIYIPLFLCDSIFDTCVEYGVDMIKYHIGIDMLPIVPEGFQNDDWLYIVNYYGQISDNTIRELKSKYQNVILDNVQSYYSKPIEGIDSFCSCRKFFGVADGAILYSDISLEDELDYDESYSRMTFLLGRYERSASEFYDEYTNNNKQMRVAPIRRMSKLTENLLHGIDYDKVAEVRSANYAYLHSEFKNINRLELNLINAPFAYPLYINNGENLKRYLISKKIYIPTLWPSVVNDPMAKIEGEMAANILPIPVDQRYSIEDMKYVVNQIMEYIERG